MLVHRTEKKEEMFRLLYLYVEIHFYYQKDSTRGRKRWNKALTNTKGKKCEYSFKRVFIDIEESKTTSTCKDKKVVIITFPSSLVAENAFTCLICLDENVRHFSPHHLCVR